MKLDQYLSTNEISDAVFAEKIGVAASTVWRLRNGKTRPDWRTLALISDATGGAVTANDFIPAPSTQPAE